MLLKKRKKKIKIYLGEIEIIKWYRNVKSKF